MNNVELDPNFTEISNLRLFGIIGLELDLRFEESRTNLREKRCGFSIWGNRGSLVLFLGGLVPAPPPKGRGILEQHQGSESESLERHQGSESEVI